jgi:hypothetical protein
MLKKDSETLLARYLINTDEKFECIQQDFRIIKEELDATREDYKKHLALHHKPNLRDNGWGAVAWANVREITILALAIILFVLTGKVLIG